MTENITFPIVFIRPWRKGPGRSGRPSPSGGHSSGPPSPPGGESLRYEDITIYPLKDDRDHVAVIRKQTRDFKPVDMDSVIRDTATILRNTLDRRIEITTGKEAERHTVMGEYSGIQNMIINMGINASHAMPGGGEFHIRTKNIYLNEIYFAKSNFDISPDLYIQVEISDTGWGISLENQKRIFEPFFTSKKVGEGTGLGFAASYGTIQDHHGAITVYSKPGEGISFLNLPARGGGNRRGRVPGDAPLQGNGHYPSRG